MVQANAIRQKRKSNLNVFIFLCLNAFKWYEPRGNDPAPWATPGERGD